jgi:hypothetical protein
MLYYQETKNENLNYLAQQQSSKLIVKLALKRSAHQPVESFSRKSRKPFAAELSYQYHQQSVIYSFSLTN